MRPSHSLGFSGISRADGLVKCLTPNSFNFMLFILAFFENNLYCWGLHRFQFRSPVAQLRCLKCPNSWQTRQPFNLLKIGGFFRINKAALFVMFDFNQKVQDVHLNLKKSIKILKNKKLFPSFLCSESKMSFVKTRSSINPNWASWPVILLN